MPSEVRLDNFWIWIMKNSKILKKLNAKWSKAKKNMEKLDRAQKLLLASDSLFNLKFDPVG